MVAECSDTDQDPKPAWDVRKQRYLAHLPEASPEALRVSLADKVHNARAIVRDYRIVGEALWGRFKSPRDQQLWYYGELARAFQKLKPGPLADELSGLVAELEELVA